MNWWKEGRTKLIINNNYIKIYVCNPFALGLKAFLKSFFIYGLLDSIIYIIESSIELITLGFIRIDLGNILFMHPIKRIKSYFTKV